jgi:predicted choloylglycine hydrolase
MTNGCGAGNGTPKRESPFITLQGSWQEIGKVQAQSFFREILQGALIFRMAYGVGFNDVEQYYEQMHHLIPTGVKRQLDGFIKGLAEKWYISESFARKAALIWNLGIDVNYKHKQEQGITGCTAFALCSKEGTFLCHNTDSYPGSQRMSKVFYYQPNNGDNAFLSFFAPGFIGVGLAINEKGLAITYNTGRPNQQPATGLPATLMSREVMASSDTIKEAEDLIKGFLMKGGYYAHQGAIFMLVDFKDNSMAKVQLCSHKIELTYATQLKPGVSFIAFTNHFDDSFAALTPEQAAQKRNVSSIARRRRLDELLHTFDHYNLQTCLAIMSDHSRAEPRNITICRHSEDMATTIGNIFTADKAYYTLGNTCQYLAEYKSPSFIDLKAIYGRGFYEEE